MKARDFVVIFARALKDRQAFNKSILLTEVWLVLRLNPKELTSTAVGRDHYKLLVSLCVLMLEKDTDYQ